jgi:hypothetical protein
MQLTLEPNQAVVGCYVPIAKASALEGIIEGVASVAGVMDDEGDVVPERDLRLAAHAFLSLPQQPFYDTHGFTKPGSQPVFGQVELPGRLVESHISGGKWHIAYKPNDIAVAKAAADGEYVGFSIDGMANKDLTQPPPRILSPLTITGISLVRRGYRPVNNGAIISIVKAQEDETMDQDTAQRSFWQSLKAGLGLPIEKAQVATQVVADDGSHGAMNGIHQHMHSHSNGKGGSYSHAHEHTHDGGSDHYHDMPGHQDSATGGAAVTKAQEATVNEELSTNIAALVSRIDLLIASNGKAEATATTAAETVAKAQEDVANKTISAEDLAKIVDERVAAGIAAGLKPISKALSDLGIAQAAVSRTPNVTGEIAPGSGNVATETDAEANAKAAKMSFADAVKYLTHRNSATV